MSSLESAAIGGLAHLVNFQVLPDYLRVIQGDGVSLKAIEKILIEMKTRKLSAENIGFGMGPSCYKK